MADDPDPAPAEEQPAAPDAEPQTAEEPDMAKDPTPAPDAAPAPSDAPLSRSDAITALIRNGLSNSPISQSLDAWLALETRLPEIVAAILEA